MAGRVSCQFHGMKGAAREGGNNDDWGPMGPKRSFSRGLRRIRGLFPYFFKRLPKRVLVTAFNVPHLDRARQGL